MDTNSQCFCVIVSRLIPRSVQGRNIWIHDYWCYLPMTIWLTRLITCQLIRSLTPWLVKLDNLYNRNCWTALPIYSSRFMCSKLQHSPFAVFDSYPDLFQREIFSVVDAVVVDVYHLLSLTPDIIGDMEVSASLSYPTVHGLLLSNTSVNHVNCALSIVQKRRIDIVTAMHFQLNVLKVSIEQHR